MNQADRDSFAHALGQTLGFYGKTLEKTDFSFWYSAMGDRSVEVIKNALKEYIKIGKYAPRPANILELMKVRGEYARTALPPPPDIKTSCPPEIAQAWMWFINHIAKGSKNCDSLFSDVGEVSIEQQEKYLHIVNHEARHFNKPDAIPDEYKLAEVWG
jgi:hypothetical protein